MKKYANKVFTPVIALVLVVFAAIMFLSFRQTAEAKFTAAMVAHSQEVLFQTAKILSTVTDNETGSRGYLLTGKPAFLDPLEKSRLNVYSQIDTLRKLTKDNPEQLSRIDSLQYYTQQRFLFSDSTILLRDKSGLDAAIELVASGNGNMYMNRIRNIAETMQLEENRLLKERETANENANHFMNGIIVSIVVIILILIIILLRKDYVAIKARKIAEETLKKNEAFLSLMTNSIKDCSIFMLDTNGQVVTWNNGAERLKGYEKNDIIGKPIAVFYTKEDIDNDEPRRNISLAKKYGQFETEGQRVRQDGSLFWAHVVLTALVNDSGDLGYSVITRDITAAKKAQEQLEFLSLQINQANDAIYVVDNTIKIKSWNLGAENLYGYGTKEVLDKDPNELLKTVISDEEIKYAMEKLHKKDYWTGELTRTTKSGDIIYVRSSTSTIRNAKEEITGYVAVSFDITEQKKLHEEINHLASLVEQSTEAIISVSLDGRIISWNAGAETLFGYNKQEAVGIMALSLGLGKLTGSSFTSPSNYLFDKVSWRAEIAFTHKNGSTFYGAVNANTIKNELGDTESVVYFVNDITLRRTLEEQLIKSNEELEQRVKERTEEIYKNEQRFRALIENSAEGIALIDESGSIFYRSPAAYKITGEIPLGHGLALIHPEDMQTVWLKGEEARKSPGVPIGFQGRFKHASGEYNWMEGTLTNLLHINGVNAVVANYRNISTRKIAEEKLIASEEQFRHTLDNMLEGVQIIGFDWRYKYVNDAMARHGKYSKEELIGYTVMAKYPGIEQSAVYDAYQRCFNERVSIQMVNEFTFPDNTKGWFDLSFQPVPEGIFILSVDITERKMAEEKLISNEIRFQSLIENISDGIVLNDADANILYQSPSVAKILGYTAEERAGKKVSDFIHPEHMDAFTNIYKTIAGSPGIPVSFQYQFAHKNGYYIWLEGVVTNLLHYPSVNAYVANYRDITQRKEAEDALRRSEKIYKTIASGIPGSVICLLDHEYRFLLVEGDMVEKLGFTKEALWGKKAIDIFPEKVFKNYEADFATVFAGETVNKEYQLSGYDLISRYIPMKDEQHNVYGIMTVAIDITNLKHAQRVIEELNHSLEEKIIKRTGQLKKTNEELEAFSYSVSHDLRAPLRAIIGFTAMLEDEYSNKLDGEATRITSIIKNNTLKMGHLIDDLLTFSRMGRQDIVKTHINMDNMVHEVTQQPDIKQYNGNRPVEWTINELPDIKGDANTIRQVWINLIGNAVKYSGKMQLPEIEIGFTYRDGFVIYFVKDNGVGFDERYLNKLFRVFQRLHSEDEFEGTGIGLAIVEKIISKHDGKVWAASAPGEGATFYFSLPY